MSYFTDVGSRIQRLLTEMIADGSPENWTDDFIEENNRRLTRAYHTWGSWASNFNMNIQQSFVASEEHQEPPMLRWLKPRAGFFVFFYLGDFMVNLTFEEERKLWREFIDNGVYLSSGEAFHCSEPGWFRVVYSTETDEVLTKALNRMGKVLMNTYSRKLTLN